MADSTRIGSFDQLLHAARAQAEPQCLLLVFADAGLPDAPTPEQRACFAAGEGGTLAPLMCVHKQPEDIAGFVALEAEAARAGPPWAILFAGALSGRDGRPPSPAQIDAALQRMVESVASGRIDGLLPFSRTGDAVLLD